MKRIKNKKLLLSILTNFISNCKGINKSPNTYYVLGDFLMFDDKGPLLFIKTVTTETEAKNQTTFDSRETNTRQMEFKETKKLSNIIEMYQKNRPVLCNLVTEKNVYSGIPYHLENNVLLFKTQDGNDEKLDISTLVKIEIIRF